MRELSQAFALAVPHDEALRIRDDVAFFQAVQAVLAKRAPGDARPEEDLDHAVRQIISRAVASEGVDRHLRRGRARRSPTSRSSPTSSWPRCAGMPQRNLAVELLQKLLKGEITTRAAQERRAGALVRRDAGADDPPLPEPRDRGGAGDRGADRAREGDARGRTRAARRSA